MDGRQSRGEPGVGRAQGQAEGPAKDCHLQLSAVPWPCPCEFLLLGKSKPGLGRLETVCWTLNDL